MPHGVAVGLDDAGVAFLVDPEKRLGRAGGHHGVDGGLQVAVGAVLVADRHGQPARQLAVRLGLGRARADRPPAHQVGHVLRGHHLQHLRSRRNPHLVDALQNLAGLVQALVHVAGPVQVGVVDEPLPADRGAGFVKVNPHHDEHNIPHLLLQRLQACGIIESPLVVVDGARPGDHQQPRILFAQDPFDGLAPGDDRAAGRIADGDLRFHFPGRDQPGVILDAQIVGLCFHRLLPHSVKIEAAAGLSGPAAVSENTKAGGRFDPPSAFLR